LGSPLRNRKALIPNGLSHDRDQFFLTERGGNRNGYRRRIIEAVLSSECDPWAEYLQRDRGGSKMHLPINSKRLDIVHICIDSECQICGNLISGQCKTETIDDCYRDITLGCITQLDKLKCDNTIAITNFQCRASSQQTSWCNLGQQNSGTGFKLKLHSIDDNRITIPNGI
jgi:hypothetical protein